MRILGLLVLMSLSLAAQAVTLLPPIPAWATSGTVFYNREYQVQIDTPTSIATLPDGHALYIRNDVFSVWADVAFPTYAQCETYKLPLTNVSWMAADGTTAVTAKVISSSCQSVTAP